MKRSTFSPICAVLDGHTIRCVQLKADEETPAVQAYAYTPYLDKPADGQQDTKQQLSDLQGLLAHPQWGSFAGDDMVVSWPKLFAQEHIHTTAFTQADEVAQTFEQLAADKTDQTMPVYATHQQLGQYVDSDSNLQTTYLVQLMPAILHHHVSELLSELPQSNIDIVSATPTLAQMTGMDSAAAQITIDMGVTASKIIVWRGSMLGLATVPIGFEHLLQQTTQLLSADRAQAYKLLTQTTQNKAIQTLLAKALQPIEARVAKLLDQTKATPTRLVVTGDGARVAGLARQLAHGVADTAVHRFDPWQSVQAYPLRPLPQSLKPTFAAALSLALYHN